jgi:stage IV sporulation protein FB
VPALAFALFASCASSRFNAPKEFRLGWEDRPYYRDRPAGGGNPLMWLLTGSVPLFTAFGIRVRAHASLLVIGVLVLLLGWGPGSTFEHRITSITMLFGIVLLHEFGHCFAARWTGGTAEEILMTPLGGLAMAYARRRPWPTFVTVAGGPLVNVIICLICGAGLFFTIGWWPLGPFQFTGAYREVSSSFASISLYLFWIYSISYFLLLFNLLPVFPLDGGQLLQSMLWPKFGYYKSMLWSVNIGIGGSVLMMMVGLATFGTVGGGMLLIFIGISCLMNCLQMRRMLIAEGPWGFSDEDSYDFGGSVITANPKTSTRKANKAAKRRQRLEDEARAEQEQIDGILAKVSATGMQSLTWLEKRALKKATQRQRERDAELSKLRRG